MSIKGRLLFPCKLSSSLWKDLIKRSLKNCSIVEAGGNMKLEIKWDAFGM